jgi:hypothetical protein
VGACDRDVDDAAFAFFMLYLYGLIVFAAGVVAFGVDHTWMLGHCQAIFTEGGKASIDTLIIVLLGMPLGVAMWQYLSEPLVIRGTPVPG